jgi:hypothetical protein
MYQNSVIWSPMQKHTFNSPQCSFLQIFRRPFHLPLSQQAFSEFDELEVICGKTLQKIQEGNKYSLSYIWGNPNFTSKKAYKVLIGYHPAPPILNGFGTLHVRKDTSFSSSF